MSTEFSSPYTVIQVQRGFIVINGKGGHERLFSNRGEAEEIALEMNKNHALQQEYREAIPKIEVRVLDESPRFFEKPDSSGRYDDEDEPHPRRAEDA